MNEHTDDGARAQLPTPGYSMDDGLAAEWLFELAESYHPSDAIHVRELAKRLRTQHLDEMEKARELARDLANEVESLKSEIDSLESDVMDANRAVEAAVDRLRELES